MGNVKVLRVKKDQESLESYKKHSDISVSVDWISASSSVSQEGNRWVSTALGDFLIYLRYGIKEKRTVECALENGGLKK